MATTAILAEISKSIRFNCDTKHFDCYISIDGDAEHYIGSAPTYSDAETKCRNFAFDFYTDTTTPEKAARIAIDGIPATNPLSVETPIATLSNALTVLGRHDLDGSPFTAALVTEHGHLDIGPAGDISGVWAGTRLEIAPDALPRLRGLFMSNTLPLLQNIARLWAHQSRTPPPPPAAGCRQVHQSITMGIAAHLEDNLAHYGLTREAASTLTAFIAELVGRELGIVDFTELPVLEAVRGRREAETA